MLLPITNFASYNITKPSNMNFGRVQTVNLKEIKNLPDLICPRCGAQIIAPQYLIEAYRELARPLKYMIQKGYMDKSKNMPALWDLLNKFAEKHPNDSLDKILEEKDNHDALRSIIEEVVANGADIKNRLVYNSRAYSFNTLENGIRKSARRELKPASVVLERMEEFIPYLKDVAEKEPYKDEIQGVLSTIEKLQKYAALYPDKTLSEILNIQEVRQEINTESSLRKEKFNKIQEELFDEFKQIIQKNADVSDYVLNGIIYNTKSTLFNNSKDTGVRLYNTLKLCRKITEQCGCPEIFDKLADIIIRVPEPPYSKYVDFAARSEEVNDGRILDSLFRNYTGSSNFIKGSEDVRQNKLAMHIGCTYKRAGMPLKEYVQIYPKMSEYICEQINQSSDYIYRDFMVPQFYIYPYQVSKHLKEVTDGKVSPDVSEYCKKVLDRAFEREQFYMEQINEISELRNEKIGKLIKARTKEEEQTARDEVDEINVSIQSAKEKLNDQRRLIGSLTKIIREGEL